MRVIEAVKKTHSNMSVAISLNFEDTVQATKHNKYLIKNGAEALCSTLVFWVRFLFILVCLPFLFIYGVCYQLKKRGNHD